MKSEKRYYSIKEVSKMLDIKEHVIRHWDSVDPKTNKFRIEGLSIRTKGGTRFFSKSHILKIQSLNNILRENGKRNHSLNLASKIFKKNKYQNSINDPNFNKQNVTDYLDQDSKLSKIKNITNSLKGLLNN